MNTMTIWIYCFDDGTTFKLLDVGFSMEELLLLQNLHGKCDVSCVRTRDEYL